MSQVYRRPWGGSDTTPSIFEKISPVLTACCDLESFLDRRYDPSKLNDISTKHIYELRKTGPGRPDGMTSQLECLENIIIRDDEVDPAITQNEVDKVRVCLDRSVYE